mmetsp:Transcript_4385/g.9472  ORF Transcript_4385/g.9472 Transcript_4385/m.9472 type:complete len:201 (-) Transcript_4385:506-1108(-)
MQMNSKPFAQHQSLMKTKRIRQDEFGTDNGIISVCLRSQSVQVRAEIRLIFRRKNADRLSHGRFRSWRSRLQLPGQNRARSVDCSFDNCRACANRRTSNTIVARRVFGKVHENSELNHENEVQKSHRLVLNVLVCEHDFTRLHVSLRSESGVHSVPELNKKSQHLSGQRLLLRLRLRLLLSTGLAGNAWKLRVQNIVEHC